MIQRGNRQPEAAIVANPYSGASDNDRRVGALAARLEEAGAVVHQWWDPAQRRAAFADPDRLERLNAVIVAGGDGTLGDVISELPEGSEAPVAVLPLGHENLFAKQFGFGLDAARLTRQVMSGETRLVDLGQAGPRAFTLMVSAGFDADVVHRVDRWRRNGGNGRNGHNGSDGQSRPEPTNGVCRRITHSAYVPRILGAIREYSYPRVRVEADGRCVEGAHAIVVNVPRYALGLRFAPRADYEDGYLDWIVFERPGLLSALQYLWLVWRGIHLKRPGAQHGRAERVRILSESPTPLQADGDPAGFTPCDVSVSRRALRVVSTNG